MSKYNAISIINESNLIDKMDILWFFIIYKKWGNRNVTLNRAKEYYENDKNKLRVQARDNYRNLYHKDKNKKR